MPDTGGVNIGSIGNLGEVVGLSGIIRHLSRAPEYAELGRQLRAAKDFNDQPAGHLLGSANGQAVRTGIAWNPTA